MYMWNLKNKQMNTTKQKQTHRYREQTSGYQRRVTRDKGHDKGRGLRSTKYNV